MDSEALLKMNGHARKMVDDHQIEKCLYHSGRSTGQRHE